MPLWGAAKATPATSADHVPVTTARPDKTASGTITESPLVLVDLITDDGLEPARDGTGDQGPRT